MFSHTLQCQTGHTHIGDYYRCFVPSEKQNCHCSEMLQTWSHILFECKTHRHHCHILGPRRTQQIEVLLGSEKGIRRLARFLEVSKAYEKQKEEPMTNGRISRGRRERGPSSTGIS